MFHFHLTEMKKFPIPDDDLLNHPCLLTLEQEINLSHTCGYISMLKTGITIIIIGLEYISMAPLEGAPNHCGGGREKEKKKKKNSSGNEQQKAEISEFLDNLRELGIGDPQSPTLPSLLLLLHLMMINEIELRCLMSREDSLKSGYL